MRTSGAETAVTVVGTWAGASWQQLGAFLDSGFGHDGPQQAFGLGGWADKGRTATESAKVALKRKAASLLKLITFTLTPHC